MGLVRMEDGVHPHSCVSPTTADQNVSSIISDSTSPILGRCQDIFTLLYKLLSYEHIFIWILYFKIEKNKTFCLETLKLHTEWIFLYLHPQ